MKFLAGLTLLSLAAAMPASRISEEIRISITVDAHEQLHVPAIKVDQVFMAPEKPPPCDKSCPEDVSHVKYVEIGYVTDKFGVSNVVIFATSR